MLHSDADAFQRITVLLPTDVVRLMDQMVQAGRANDHSELTRDAILLLERRYRENSAAAAADERIDLLGDHGLLGRDRSGKGPGGEAEAHPDTERFDTGQDGVAEHLSEAYA